VTGWLQLLAPTKAVRLRLQVVHVRIVLEAAVIGQVSLRLLRLSRKNEGYRSHITPPATIRQCSMTIHLSPIACLPKKEAKCFKISRGDVEQ
jgi:hypothetical protein